MKLDRNVLLGCCLLGLSACVVILADGQERLVRTQRNLDNKLNDVLKGIDRMSNNIDVDIPESIVNAAVNRAVDKHAEDAATHVLKSVAKSIDERVTEVTKSAYKNVENDIKKKLLDKVNLQTIEEIKTLAAKEIAKKTSIPIYTLGASTKESIIKTCTDSGMSAWEIERILKAAKGD
jgi:hypothetical protein